MNPRNPRTLTFGTRRHTVRRIQVAKTSTTTGTPTDTSVTCSAWRGFDSAQRFRFETSHPAEAAAPPYNYLALYEIEEDRLEEARAALSASTVERAEAIAAGRKPQVSISPALSDDRVAYWHTERVMAKRD